MAGKSSVFHFDAIFSTTNEVSFFGATKNATKSQKDFQQATALTNVETQKLEARLQSTQVRLNTLQQVNSKAAIEATRLSVTLSQQTAQYERLGTAIDAMQAKAAAGKLNPGLIASLEKQQDLYQKLGASIQTNAAAEQRQQSTIAYTSAQIQVKSARIAELQAQLSGPQAKKPTFFESVKAALQETFSSWENFSNAAHKAVITYDRFTRGLQRTIKIANELSTAFTGKELFPTKETEKATKTISAATKSFSMLGSTVDAVKAPFTAFNFLLMSAASFVGNLAASLVQQGIAALVNFGRSAVQAASDFERLSLSMKSLVARELQNNDASLSFEDAMQKASGRAQELLKWTERLAILSPFSVEDVKGTLQMAIAMGMTSDQAQRVTQDLLNWAAATGKGGAEIGRATYALSQMSSAGRLTGQDIMQLSQIGISADQILSKSLGHTVAEIREMREKGLIPVSDAIEAILTDLEKFGNAAQQQSESFSGLLSSLGDLATTTARNMFGPLVTETKRFGSAFSDELGGIQETTETKVGGILGAIQPRLASLVSFLSSDLFQNGIQAMSRTLGDMASQAFDWGENIVNQFANGMISAIGAILDALASIGNIITSWLAPGSPPKLLPELDKWGTGAMMAYMEGWSADTTSVFSDLSGTISSYLKSLPKGLVAETDFVPLMLRVREQLAQGLSQLGKGISIPDLVNNILATTGAAGAGLQGYLTSLLELQQANEGVAAAQKKVNDITEQYDKLLQPIEDQLQDIDDAQAKLHETQQISNLELILKDPHATLAEKQNAQFEIEKIQAQQKRRQLESERRTALTTANAELDAAQAKQEAAQKEFDRQRALLDIQQENNRLLAEQAELMERLAKAAEKASGGGKGKPTPPVAAPFKGGVGKLPVPELPQELLDRIAELQKTFSEKIQAIKAAWTSAWTAIQRTLAPVTESFEKVKTAISTLFSTAIEKLGPRATELIGKGIGLFFETLGQKLPPILDNITIILNNLTGGVRALGDSQASVNVPLLLFNIVLKDIIFVLDALTTAIAAFSEALKGNLSGAWQIVVDAWNRNFGQTAASVAAFFGAIWSVITSTFANIWAFVSPWLALFQSVWGSWGTVIVTIWKTIWNTLWFSLGAALALIGAVFLAFVNLFTGNFKGFLDKLKAAWTIGWNILKTQLSAIWESIKLIVSTAIENIQTLFTGTDWAALGTAIVDGIIEGLKSAASFLYEQVAKLIQGIFNTAQTEAESQSPSKKAMRLIGKPIGQGGALGVLSTIPQAQKASQMLVKALIAPPMAPVQSMSSVSYNTTNQKSVTFAPTYNTNAAPPLQDWGTLQALAA